MTGEVGSPTYTDVMLTDYIERYPLTDVYGVVPPETEDGDIGAWIPTYDLHAAAADLWQEKATAVIDQFDFSADGGSYSRAQRYNAYMQRVAFHLSRRSIRNIGLSASPSPSDLRDHEDADLFDSDLSN